MHRKLSPASGMLVLLAALIEGGGFSSHASANRSAVRRARRTRLRARQALFSRLIAGFYLPPMAAPIRSPASQ